MTKETMKISAVIMFSIRILSPITTLVKGAWKYRNGPERTEWTKTDRNGSEWTGMDPNGPEWTKTDRNGPKDTMKSLALHPLFNIRIEKSLNIFILA